MRRAMFSFVFRDYRSEWEKIRTEADAKKTNTEKADILTTEIGIGRELSEIYLRHPANESSTDSEGEEAEPQNDEVEAETFRKVMEQQKELQVKRAKEAAERNRIEKQS